MGDDEPDDEAVAFGRWLWFERYLVAALLAIIIG
jgi:hypothetical protein